MLETCSESHDLRTTLLSTGICIGLIISYLPQFIRIIQAKSSEGFSPWFLLLGATSSTSGMLNIWILQWPVIKCCKVIKGGSCFEQTLGIAQVTLQWACFSFLFLLYIYYFPPHLKYIQVIGSSEETMTEETPLIRESEEEAEGEINLTGSAEWRLAVTLAIAVAVHLSVLTILSVVFLFRLPLSPLNRLDPLLYTYAQFLGISATALTFLQYAPQIIRTYRLKIVGALSISMMLIQVPGSAMFVGSLIGREGVEWSAWLPYAFAGSMQAVLLFMCLMWKVRQRNHGQDDFGNPMVVEEDERE